MKEKLFKVVKNIVLWMWQFPLNFLAFVIYSLLGYYAYYGGDYNKVHIIYNEVFPSSFSLGDYLFTHKYASEDTFKHEYGHHRQSVVLGPLYLIVIGIPSVLHNLIHTICGKFGLNWNYYSFYTERFLMDN